MPDGEGRSISGVMPVAFAVDVAQKTVLAAGFPSFDQMETLVTCRPGSLAMLASFPGSKIGDANPVAVKALSGVHVGTQVKDLVVVLTDKDLRVYDATHHPIGEVRSARLHSRNSAYRVQPIAWRLKRAHLHLAPPVALSVVDISRPTAPTLVATVSGFGSTSIAVRDGFVHRSRRTRVTKSGSLGPWPRFLCMASSATRRADSARIR